MPGSRPLGLASLSRERHHDVVGFGGTLSRRHREHRRETGHCKLGNYRICRGAARRDLDLGQTPQPVPAPTGGVGFPG